MPSVLPTALKPGLDRRVAGCHHAASGELHIRDLPVTSACFCFGYQGHKEEELWEEGTWRTKPKLELDKVEAHVLAFV